MRTTLFIVVGVLLMMSPIFAANWCYQESPGVSNQSGTDGSCLLNYSGVSAATGSCSWTYGGAATIDGNWSTSDHAGCSNGEASKEFTYIKPYGATSAFWTTKDFTSFANRTIPSNCWSYNSTALFLRMEEVMTAGPYSTPNWYCKNASGWNKLYNGTTTFGYQEMYEEGVTWDVGIKNLSICGNLIDSGATYTLNQSVVQTDASGQCFAVSSNNIVLECNGFYVNRSASSSYAIFSTGKNITIRNCIFGGVTSNNGVYFESNANNITFINNTVVGASIGLFISGGITNIIENNTINSSSFPMLIDVNNSYFTNNTIKSSSYVLVSAGTTTNYFALNNFSRSTGVAVTDYSGLNFYNYTCYGKNQGNMWANVVNGSLEIFGLTNSSVSGLVIGDIGLDYPYTPAKSGGLFSCAGSCADYAPLTSRSDFTNTAPTITAISVYAENASKPTSLYCNVTAVDIEQTVFNGSITWYKNGAYYQQTSYSNLLNNTPTLLVNIPNSVLTKNDSWNCDALVIDSYLNYSSNNSSAITIANAVPTIPTTINQTGSYKNDSFVVGCSGSTDADSDTLTYYYSFNSTVGSVLQVYSTNNTYSNCINNATCNKTADIISYCYASDGTNISAIKNQTIDILNSIPTINSSIIFVNSTTNHSFSASAVVRDYDGASDISSSTMYSTLGTCNLSSTSNTTILVNKTYICTSTQMGVSYNVIRFYDNSSAYVDTANVSNEYPDFAPKITVPSIAGTVYRTSIVNCTNGSFTGIDNDTENVTSRIWIWYRNGTAIANQTSQLINLNGVNISKGDNLACRENVSANYWLVQASNVSANKSISNLAPTVNAPSLLYTTPTIIQVNCSATDEDGGSDIVQSNLTSSAGVVVALANGSTGTSFWKAFNVTGLSSLQTINVSCSVMDSSSAVASSANASFTTTDGDYYGAEVQNGQATLNNVVRWSLVYNTVGALHVCSYTYLKTDVVDGLGIVTNGSGNLTVFNESSTHMEWYCEGAESPYIIYFSTQNITYVQSAPGGSVLGNNTQKFAIYPNTTLNYDLLFSAVYPTASTNRKLWQCTLNNATTCDVATASQWITIEYTENLTDAGYNATKVFSITSPNLVLAMTNDGIGGGVVPGGGGGSYIYYEIVGNQSNGDVVGIYPGAGDIFEELANAVGATIKFLKEETPFINIQWFWVFIGGLAVVSGKSLTSKKQEDKNVGSIAFVAAALLFVVFVMVG